MPAYTCRWVAAGLVGAFLLPGSVLAQQVSPPYAGPYSGAVPAPPPQGVAPAPQGVASPPQGAMPAPGSQEWRDLRATVARHEKQLEAQAQALDQHAHWLDSYREALDEQRRALDYMQLMLVRGAGAPGVSGSGPGPAPQVQEGQAGAAEEGAAPEGSVAPEGGAEVDEEGRPPEVTLIAERGGVLTRKGWFVVQPEFEYSHSSLNRFVFQGIELVETVLIGVIEASDADRDSYTESVTLRYGITNRLEVDTRIPYVIRDDRVTNTVVNISPALATTQELSGDDIGDVEFGAHYQINYGLGGWPFFVANVRAKTDTGTGPFDVPRDANGIETELATGSGFWGVEPSLTVIYPTDPAVLFANVGYLWNIERDIDQQVGSSFISTVNPGDSINVSFGLGVALNEKVSISLGYDHSYVQGTESTIGGTLSESDSLQVGSFLFGISMALTDSIGINVNLAAGQTEDAPDARVTVRLPIAFNLFGSET